jgi:cell division protein FtsQ
MSRPSVPRRRPRRPLPWKAVAALCLAGAVGGFAWYSRPLFSETWFPVQYVRVEGDVRNLDLGKLNQALLPAVNAGYFSLDIREIEGVARSIAWVDSVQITRLWPDTLVVSVVEHKPVARWGDNVLLNDRGERFAPDSAKDFKDLPVIYGPAGMELFLLGMLKRLDDKLENMAVHVASLDLSKRRSWSVKLNSGMEIQFGRQDPVASLAHFLEFIPKLGENNLDQLLRADLRYPNGFALVRKAPPETDAGPKAPALGFRLIGTAGTLALDNH